MLKLTIKQVNYIQEIESIKMIRQIVFQEEQGINPDLEFDGYDETCQHLLAYLDNQPVGTTRIRFLDQTTAKIERVAVLPHGRGQGIATELMKVSLSLIKDSNCPKVIVNAQKYIQELYKKLGFETIGDRFEEAGITHVKMIKYSV
ncbi:GNAT family N-acetyltransferase [Aphanothece sacrum]|uniref:N-acetyltransferase GCN5 n=1 Tax=Aphanothece sacrum FPU1 TaxID=1920663 RepID=A0A401IJK9_APHSA|nr:GNAT family N-acetyltransferase [Aphanothece sacrum]GBF81482.1 N-acetyltransferase GCN5 [Aphanothece sacrum FPU1]GBF85613.1 N-acetyltransferase GCN5 [Aphanothece sacrum FPU3]